MGHGHAHRLLCFLRGIPAELWREGICPLCGDEAAPGSVGWCSECGQYLCGFHLILSARGVWRDAPWRLRSLLKHVRVNRLGSYETDTLCRACEVHAFHPGMLIPLLPRRVCDDFEHWVKNSLLKPPWIGFYEDEIIHVPSIFGAKRVLRALSERLGVIPTDAACVVAQEKQVAAKAYKCLGGSTIIVIRLPQPCRSEPPPLAELSRSTLLAPGVRCGRGRQITYRDVNGYC